MELESTAEVDLEAGLPEVEADSEVELQRA
jgi:hypothetical protein